VGDAAQEPLAAETAVAWAFWLQLNRARLEGQGKAPLGITIAAWRKAHSQPPGDCRRLARAWLAMSDGERRQTLAAAAAPLFGLHTNILPESLWPYDLPGETLYRLQEATHGRFLPLVLLPPEEPVESDEKAVAPEPLPLPTPPASEYQMPPTTAVLWQSVLDELALQMAQATFNTWLRDSKLRLNGGTAAVVYTRNTYAADWINARLRDTVNRTLSAIAGRELIIEACAECADVGLGP